MTNNVNQKFIPVEMTREQYLSLAGAEKYEFKGIKIGVRSTTGILVPASEEQYRNYMHSLWNEEKSVERQRRCMIISPKTGKLIKCKGCCEKCNRMKDGQTLSLDMFYDETEYEIPDDNQSLRNIETQFLFEQLLDILENQAPELAQIFEEMYNGVAQREIERKLGIAHGTMTDMVKRMRDILQQHVTREDLLG